MAAPSGWLRCGGQTPWPRLVCRLAAKARRRGRGPTAVPGERGRVKVQVLTPAINLGVGDGTTPAVI